MSALTAGAPFSLHKNVKYVKYSGTSFNKGFTLIELMIAITVLGVLLAVGLPSFSSLMLNQEVKTSMSDFHLALLLAKSEVIKQNSDIVVASNGSGWDVKFGFTVLMTKDDLSSNITTSCDGSCPSSIIFKRTGRLDPDDSPFELRFCVNGGTTVVVRCVSVSLSGRAHVEYDSDNNPANEC